MSVWFNRFRRWVGFVEHPPATSAATSITFVLQSARAPMRFEELQRQTTIRADDLAAQMEALKLEGRIKVEIERDGDGMHKVYSIKYPSEQLGTSWPD